jgi:hypothetical protein
VVYRIAQNRQPKVLPFRFPQALYGESSHHSSE